MGVSDGEGILCLKSKLRPKNQRSQNYKGCGKPRHNGSVNKSLHLPSAIQFSSGLIIHYSADIVKLISNMTFTLGG